MKSAVVHPTGREVRAPAGMCRSEVRAADMSATHVSTTHVSAGARHRGRGRRQRDREAGCAYRSQFRHDHFS
jgi:hypothetical protein